MQLEESKIYSEKDEFFYIEGKKVKIIILLIMYYPVGMLVSFWSLFWTDLDLKFYFIIGGFISILLSFISIKRDYYHEITDLRVVRKKSFDNKNLFSFYFDQIDYIFISFDSYKKRGDLGIHFHIKNSKTVVKVRMNFIENKMRELITIFKNNNLDIKIFKKSNGSPFKEKVLKLITEEINKAR